MPQIDATFWTARLEHTLGAYSDTLLRQMAGKLFKPRSQWPAEELIERSLATLENTAVVDRRLQDLDPPARQVLACIGHSRQPRWNVGNLVELAVALGHADGLEPIRILLDAGLIYPDLPGNQAPEESAAASNGPRVSFRLKTFDQWLTQGTGTAIFVFAHPHVMNRARTEALNLPTLARTSEIKGGHHEADGLEWPLRLLALWQQVRAASLRRTQQGEFFKRDLDRLRDDPLLSGPPAENLYALPDPALLVVALAELEGLVRSATGELVADALPTFWDEGLAPVLASLWSAWPLLTTWNPLKGGGIPWLGNPFPSAGLLAVLLLRPMGPEEWIQPEVIEEWLIGHHPYWQGTQRRGKDEDGWVSAFLLGVAYPLRIVQAAKDMAGKWVVRLSPMGRWLLGIGEQPADLVPHMQTLLVQPNLEIIAYRQGLTPALAQRLSRFALWKNLGPACTLQLQADTVYQALESGLTFEDMLQTLERSGMRALPTAVVESLRTWANKRERISVYPAATLLEFRDAVELNEALARGQPGIRVADNLLVLANENDVDYRHFRLLGARDYSLPPEKCVDIESDGVTLDIDLARSDLLLDTELQRFAETVDTAAINGRRRYRLTPQSLAAARERGLDAHGLDDWFRKRAGQELSAAARLLLAGADAKPLSVQSRLVIAVASKEVADGLLQWPGTRSLIEERLGPTALAVSHEALPILRERLAAIGVKIDSADQAV